MDEIAIIGGGPAGLMAAEIIADGGYAVTVYDHMPSVGRKFLMAGRGGLNLTNSEPLDPFIARYGSTSAWLDPVIRAFPPSALLNWCHGLGQQTFVGSSGRVFPAGLKASPLLRAWLQRLDKLGVAFKLKHRWQGWDADGNLIFAVPDKTEVKIKAVAILLALGGASWPRLGSNGSWAKILNDTHIPVAPLAPANCGFIVPWSDIFREKCAGQPLKPVTISFDGTTLQGEVMITSKGLEGGVIYALSSKMRDKVAAEGFADIALDLRPGISLEALTTKLEARRGSETLTSYLRKLGSLSPAALALVHEAIKMRGHEPVSAEDFAHLIKACPVRFTAPAPLERAISTAGGIRRDALDDHFMLKAKPGVFAAGEMLDWEAPTGGYLLQASFSTAVAAAQGMLDWLNAKI